MSQDPTTRRAILEVLEKDGPSTAKHIAAALGRNRSSVNCAIRNARKAGVLRIANWSRSLGTGGRIAPVYEAAPLRDAPPIDALTPAFKSSTYRERWGHVIRLRVRASRGSPVAPWLAGLA